MDRDAEADVVVPGVLGQSHGYAELADGVVVINAAALDDVVRREGGGADGIGHRVEAEVDGVVVEAQIPNVAVHVVETVQAGLFRTRFVGTAFMV